jgi:metabolite-proton symporter
MTEQRVNTATIIPPASRAPGTGRIVIASLVGTTIEFYDFYIYGTAAALVLGRMFFPHGAPEIQSLAAFATFGIAFLARPLGAVLFGHFGDRMGRKSTLVVSLMTMGLSTTLIGVLPNYASAGMMAPILLCILRLGQGIGLGGEWGGAALIATENAPSERSAWFGMFPQLGPALGFLLANGLFLLLFFFLSDAQFLTWGWRIPFLASAVLVAIGLFVRQTLPETPAFARLVSGGERVRVPLGEVLRHHGKPLILGSLAMVVCYAIFYISTVFALGYGTSVGHIPRATFLELLCMAVLAMAAVTPVSAFLADRFGCRPVLLAGAALAAISGLTMQPLLSTGTPGDALVFLVLELGLMGLLFAPMGAFLPALFPANVRYTGASMAYNLGGILGGSFAPLAAQMLLTHGGLARVGLYISGAAVLSFMALISIRTAPAGSASPALLPCSVESERTHG